MNSREIIFLKERVSLDIKKSFSLKLFQYQDEHEKLKKCLMSKFTLEYSLGEEIKKNNELKEEVAR